MCGIAGWYRYSDSKITRKELLLFLSNLEVRGKDATGVGWEANSIFILCSPDKAKDFIKLDAFKKDIPEILDSKWGFLHTRQGTHGTNQNNLNNHPIMNGKGLIIHNGVVNFTTPHIVAKGETDSEQLMLNIQEHGWQKALSSFYGSASFAYKDFKKVGFYLYTNGNMPLVWGYDEERKILLFCSTKNILEKSYKPATEMKIASVPTKEVFYVDKRGMSPIMKIKEASYGYNIYNGARLYSGPIDAEWARQECFNSFEY